MKIIRYDPSMQVQWDAFAAGAKNAHFLHQRGYMDYHADRFADHSLLVMEEDALLALLPANARDGVLYSHQGLTFGGFITSADMRAAKMLAVFDALVAYAKSAGFTKITYKAMPFFYHQLPAAEDLYALFRAGAVLSRVDIATLVDYAQPLPFSTLRKRGAKKAQKQGITVRRSEDFAGYHAILRSIVEGKYDAQVTHSQAELELLAGRFPEQVQLHAAYLGEAMVAGVIIYETATVAHAQYIGANADGREHGALDLLFSELIAHYAKSKRYFDFGISTEQAGRVLNENLIAQKEGFGGRAATYEHYELALG